jgi:hypothetical protein
VAYKEIVQQRQRLKMTSSLLQQHASGFEIWNIAERTLPAQPRVTSFDYYKNLSIFALLLVISGQVHEADIIIAALKQLLLRQCNIKPKIAEMDNELTSQPKVGIFQVC